MRYKDHRRQEIERELFDMPTRQEIEARPIQRGCQVQAWKYMRRGDVWISPDGWKIACSPEDFDFCQGLLP